MYSYVLITSIAVLFLGLLGFLWAIVTQRVLQTAVEGKANSAFGAEFIDELTRLSQVALPAAPVPPVIDDVMEDAYTLHERGESPFRMASRLGIGKADAELLIKIADGRRAS